MTDTMQLKDSSFIQEIERRSDTPVSACYQCHKCSTGCPIGPEMEWLPSQIMRLIHFGQDSTLLESPSVWFCASCEACTTRCPMEIDIARVMDTLRIVAIERKASLPDSRGSQFNQSFLSSVRRHGRVFELGMLTAYKFRSLDFFADLDKAPKMMAKGKLSFLPSRSESAGEVKQIFKRAEKEENKR